MTTYQDIRFSTRREMADLLIAKVLEGIADKPGPRVLDLGCGTGQCAIGLALRNPNLRAIALDVSRPNVDAAQRAAEAAGVGDRATGVCADYGSWSHAPFDAIVSDSVLHLIDLPSDKLAARLSADLKPGGLLVATMPVVSTGNSLRIALRRLWSVMPRGADHLAVAVAARLYPDFSRDMVAERVPYLRVVPRRLFGPALTAQFEACGLEVIADEPWESPSAAKLTHRLVTWRRR